MVSIALCRAWRGVKRLVTLHDLLIMQADDSIASEAFRKKRCQLYRTAAEGLMLSLR